MSASEECQDGGPARCQFVHRNGQPDIAARIFQSGLQSINGVFAPSRSSVDFGEIQVELRLIPLHSNRGVAQSFRLAPFSLGARQHHAQVGHVIGIVLVQVHGEPHMRQSFYSVIVSQECQSSLEFTKGFRIHHRLTSSTAERPDSKPGARRLRENRISGRLGSSRAALDNCANFSSESPKRNVPRSQAMSGTASNTVASRLPIPVLFEATRSFNRNLLTRRTVLGQRHWSWGVKNQDRCSAAVYCGVAKCMLADSQ